MLTHIFIPIHIILFPSMTITHTHSHTITQSHTHNYTITRSHTITQVIVIPSWALVCTGNMFLYAHMYTIRPTHALSLCTPLTYFHTPTVITSFIFTPQFYYLYTVLGVVPAQFINTMLVSCKAYCMSLPYTWVTLCGVCIWWVCVFGVCVVHLVCVCVWCMFGYSVGLPTIPVTYTPHSLFLSLSHAHSHAHSHTHSHTHSHSLPNRHTPHARDA